MWLKVQLSTQYLRSSVILRYGILLHSFQIRLLIKLLTKNNQGQRKSCSAGSWVMSYDSIWKCCHIKFYAVICNCCANLTVKKCMTSWGTALGNLWSLIQCSTPRTEDEIHYTCTARHHHSSTVLWNGAWFIVYFSSPRGRSETTYIVGETV